MHGLVKSDLLYLCTKDTLVFSLQKDLLVRKQSPQGASGRQLWKMQQLGLPQQSTVVQHVYLVVVGAAGFVGASAP